MIYFALHLSPEFANNSDRATKTAVLSILEMMVSTILGAPGFAYKIGPDHKMMAGD
jgi:hypothetical protein